MSKPARQAASMCQHKRGCGTQTKSIKLSLLRRNKREDNLIFVSPPEQQMMGEETLPQHSGSQLQSTLTGAVHKMRLKSDFTSNIVQLSWGCFVQQV